MAAGRSGDGRGARSRGALAVAAALVLAACREDPPRPAAPATPPAPEAAILAVVEAPLAARLRGADPLRRRGVQVFPQALPGHHAVCGRAMPPGAEAWIPYVAVVTVEAGTPRLQELVLGATGAEASRAFVEMVDRCFEGGGPANARAAARPLPPLPDAPPAAASAIAPALPPPRPEAAPAPPAPPALPPGPAPLAAPGAARFTVVTSTRTPANIRSAPREGEVVRTAARGSTLQVFAEAPGGWLQVGQDDVVWGWLHASLLER